MLTAVTVHFNTIDLTSCLCGSLRKFHPDCRIIVIDNSTTRPLPVWIIKWLHIEYYDNTKGQLINFDNYCRNAPIPIDANIKETNNLASAKHALTIEWALKNLKCDDFVLFDSDVLLKRPIDFANSNFITVGALSYAEHLQKKVRRLRLLPYCQYFNAKLFRNCNLQYFDPSRIIGFDPRITKGYDTGTSFFEDVAAKYPAKYKIIDSLDKYIIHYRGGSWQHNTSISSVDWLFSNQNLFNGNVNNLLQIGLAKQHNAIISLTSWKARIYMVGLTIYSLLTMCPGFHIVLCLSLREFPNKLNDLPPDLQLLSSLKSIEILWCADDLKPHKKYFYTMLKYRHSPIITVDDDQIPVSNIANTLLLSYLKNPNVVHAGRVHEIRYNKNGSALPYDQWKRCQTTILEPSSRLFATGCGGVLYPPNILQMSESELNTIRDIITADDIYLKVRENKLNIKVKYVPGCNFIEQKDANGLALNNNLGLHLNDKYIKKYL